MRKFNETAFTIVMASSNKLLAWYCQWLVDAPTFGARLFTRIANEWFTTEDVINAAESPEIHDMLKRHFNNDPELLALQKKLEIEEINA